MDGYFDIRSIETGEKLDLSDEGVLVPRRFWKSHGEKLDGKVPVYNADMDRVEIPIVGVFENYFGQVFFLTPKGYESCFKTPAGQTASSSRRTACPSTICGGSWSRSRALSACATPRRTGSRSSSSPSR